MTGTIDSTRPLPIPPLYEGTLDGDVRRFELTAQEGEYEILPTLAYMYHCHMLNHGTTE